MQQTMSLDDADESTLSALYQSYAPGILAYLRSHIPLREDAEDLLIEIFLAACSSSQFSSLAEPQQRAWLWRVAHHKMVDHYRVSARRQTLNVDTLANELYSGDETVPEQVAEHEEEFSLLRKHVELLPTAQQDILRLRFAQDMQCSEIARRLGKSHAAVRMQLSRTLNFLRSIYLRHEENDNG